MILLYGKNLIIEKSDNIWQNVEEDMMKVQN